SQRIYGGSLLTSLARGGTGLRLLGALLRAALVAAAPARGVARSAHDVRANARKILHTTAANEHDRVLLEVVAFAGDVGGDFEAVGETDTGNLAERRDRPLWGGGVQ